MEEEDDGLGDTAVGNQNYIKELERKMEGEYGTGSGGERRFG